MGTSLFHLYLVYSKHCRINTSPSDLHKSVSMVSDSEFQSLPSYLKLTTLHNLNQAIHNINTFMADYSGTDSFNHFLCILLNFFANEQMTIKENTVYNLTRNVNVDVIGLSSAALYRRK